MKFVSVLNLTATDPRQANESENTDDATVFVSLSNELKQEQIMEVNTSPVERESLNYKSG